VKLEAYCIKMYKSVIDSGWIQVSPLTTLVGKNEAGKTSLLKALHKLNPFKPDAYSMDREWPRGHRKERNPKHIVCRAKFRLNDDEIAHLSEIAGQPFSATEVEVTRTYAGDMEVLFPDGLFHEKLRPNQIDPHLTTWPAPQEPIGEGFRTRLGELQEEARDIARQGKFSDFSNLQTSHTQRLQQAHTGTHPQNVYEQQYIQAHSAKLSEIAGLLPTLASELRLAHEYVVGQMPTFIYMDDYRTFSGTARLDQVKQRIDAGTPNEEDKSLLVILELAGLDLAQETAKSGQTDSNTKEQRQFDLDDASATLTREIEGRWKQKKYQVQFRADGPQFFTFVKDEKDPALIKLEERSKGFQWFFSFDLLFMYESDGEFQNCVLLLDEPGLHLHPDAQKDLLMRLERYAEVNTLIYSTHLPFMIDLRHPDRIRVVSETLTGTVVTEDLAKSQPEARFTLQAALGMSGSSSYLLSKRNLVVEGVDDYWVVSELSNLFIRSGSIGLPEDVFVTSGGGASESTYIATFMIGQKLSVVVLFDTDDAGNLGKDRLVKSWLTLYNESHAKVLSLGTVVDSKKKEFSIEDLFPEKFYVGLVKQAYAKEIALAGAEPILQGQGQLCKRVENAMLGIGIKFNKGRVAKLLRRTLSQMKDATALPQETREMGEKLIKAINDALPPLED
jgi:predicted ATPase